MAKVGLRDIALAIAKKKGMDVKVAENYVESFFSIIEDYIIPDKVVKIKGFGTFKRVDVRDRESVDVNTGDRVVIDGHAKITFLPDASLKELVNKPFSQFETVVLNDGVDFDNFESSQVEGTENLSENDSTEFKEFSGEQLENIAPEEAEIPVAAVINEDIDDTETEESPLEASFENKEDETEDEGNNEVSMPEEPKNDGQLENEQDESTENTTSTTNEGDENKNNNMKNKPRSQSFLMPILIIIGVIVVFMCGYLIGENKDEAMPVTVISPNSQVSMNVEAQSMKNGEKKTDSVSASTKESKKQSAKAIKAKASLAKQPEKPKEMQERVKEEKPETQAKAEPAESKQLKTARRYVQTGAYKIVGTDKTIKVRAGQTIKGIARTYLGDGMECYIQVHNGKMEVKEGEKVNIPKLQLKKKTGSKKES